MRHSTFIASAFTLLIASQPALACVCLPGEDAATAFRNADAVFLAKVIAIRSLPAAQQTGLPGAALPVEEAELIVEKAWKNARAGDRVLFRSVQNTSCSRSFTELSGDPLKPADRWILYVSGEQPYQLGICESSYPLTDPTISARKLDAMVRRR